MFKIYQKFQVFDTTWVRDMLSKMGYIAEKYIFNINFAMKNKQNQRVL